MCFQTRAFLTGCTCFAAEQADAFKSDFVVETILLCCSAGRGLPQRIWQRKAQRDLDLEHIFTQSACRWAVEQCTTDKFVIGSCVRHQKRGMKQQPPHSPSNGISHLAVKLGAHDEEDR